MPANTVVLTGYLGRDPEDVVPNTEKFRRYAKFDVAFGGRKFQRQGNTNWITVMTRDEGSDWVIDKLQLRCGDYVTIVGHLSSQHVKIGPKGKQKTVRYITLWGEEVNLAHPGKNHPAHHMEDEALEGIHVL
jgi:hypothetical protein